MIISFLSAQNGEFVPQQSITATNCMLPINIWTHSASLKLNIKKLRSWDPAHPSCQREGEKVEAVTNFIIVGSKFSVDDDCSYEIRSLLLGRKAMTNINSMLRNRNIILPKKLVVFGLFIWISKLSVQYPLVFEVPQVSGPSRFPRLFCAFLDPVLKSAISLRIHGLSDGKCTQNLHVRPQNSHCYQVAIAFKLYSGQRRKNTFYLKNKIERNVINWYKLMISLQDLRQQDFN